MDSAWGLDSAMVVIRWIHVLAAIMWVGLGYWLNFVNAPTQLSLDLETRQKIAPQLLPRTMFWFSEAGDLTLLTGVILLAFHYYWGGLLFSEGDGWGLPSFVMLAVVFGIWFVYDWLYRGPLRKNDYVATVVSIVLLFAIITLFDLWADWTYRGFSIHTGAMFGVIMMINFRLRLKPAQQKMGAALMAGAPPDPDVVAMVTDRSRHNISLSIPLIWTMISSHSTTLFDGSRYVLMSAVVIGFIIADLMIKKIPTVKGM